MVLYCINSGSLHPSFVTQTPLSFFDRGCLFLEQVLLMVCRLHRKLQITAMTLGSKVNKNLSNTCMVLTKVPHILYCMTIANMTFESKVKVTII